MAWESTCPFAYQWCFTTATILQPIAVSGEMQVNLSDTRNPGNPVWQIMANLSISQIWRSNPRDLVSFCSICPSFHGIMNPPGLCSFRVLSVWHCGRCVGWPQHSSSWMSENKSFEHVEVESWNHCILGNTPTSVFHSVSMYFAMVRWMMPWVYLKVLMLRWTIPSI